MAPKSLAQIDGLMIDLDGTTYLGDYLLPGAAEFYHAARDLGKRILYITNNSSKSPEQYLGKLRALGIPARNDEVFTSGEATLIYLKQKGCRSIFPIATTEFRRMMVEAGFAIDDEHPDYVVLGFDTELTYEKLRTGCLLLKKGARFVASHPDPVCPMAEGEVPDAGSMLALIETATDRKPEVIVGKPNPLMFELGLKRLKVPKASTAMVGDRISTDVAMAEHAGVTSILVLSGVTTPEEAEQSHHRIDYVVQTMADIIPMLTS
ncbi:MAG TPA: HAD-IIA family hydrolase [Planctomycetota bacterium]|nr:HAD-IIA family hydrolase [Planctomycetota bacterium]